MNTKTIYILTLAILTAIILTGCGINSNVMFKQPKGDIYQDSIPLRPSQAYKISIDDKISFSLAVREGEDVVFRLSNVESGERVVKEENEYLVRKDGTVELPVLGEVYIAGLTVEECEDTLISLFSNHYQEPFVQVKITNQRVIVFPGNGSDAKVIRLENENTTLMEAIALAGGITERGKANTVKLMRLDDGKRVVYTIDLSTIEGLKYTDMVVQANDYIYIEPTPDIGKEIAEDVVPFVSILSSVIIIFTAINFFK